MSRTVTKGGAKRLGACLPDHLKSGLSERLDEDSRLRQAWHACVAEPLASHAHPVRYAAGLLFIHADSPAWISRLRHQQPALITALRRNAWLKDLTDLRLRVVPRDAPTPAPRAIEQPTRLSAKAAQVVAQTADTVADPALRAALERLSRSGSPPNPKRRP